GNTVEQIITKENFVAYFGGDTFLAVVNDSNDKRMEELLKKINERLKNSWVIDGQEFKISMSIGAAVYPVDGKDTGSLLKNADLAMYKAKENGGAQTYICSQAMREEVEKKQIITNYLYKAIERKEIYLVFQPKVNASSEKIEAVEALVRWNNKEIGMIPPAVFIPLAERTGIINQIGEWVFEEACRQSRRWKEMGKKLIPIAVNVSGYQLQDVKIISKMKHIILENMVDPKFIEIEVTESIAMNLAGDVSELLFQLKKIGISIAIDDFGTGYSSLSRLNELPIDVLKIDKKFVDGILKSDRERAMIKTIIDLAKNLNLKIVAEGAETKEQVDFLKQKQCDFIQGYYYFKPLSVEELNTYL
ncbi:MAG TPA: bifunctional diguanylate cyclase/phosphodiesterase, partial [Lachnospiraceae bacterium]|nr:bifunctional diguanylate cyclase/phosphodiesterase [Lachnospiraceae bacterium]